MRREIVQLQKKLGVTTIYVTHDQVEALTMADRIVVLESGVIRQIGTVDEIYNSPADIFVAGFIGTPRMNFVNGWIDDNRIKPFNLSGVYIPPKYSLREITLGIRPEDIIFDEQGVFSGLVKNIEYLGDRNIVQVDFLDQSLTLTTKPQQCKINNKNFHGFNSQKQNRSQKVLIDKLLIFCGIN